MIIEMENIYINFNILAIELFKKHILVSWNSIIILLFLKHLICVSWNRINFIFLFIFFVIYYYYLYLLFSFELLSFCVIIRSYFSDASSTVPIKSYDNANS